MDRMSGLTSLPVPAVGAAGWCMGRDTGAEAREERRRVCLLFVAHRVPGREVADAPCL